MEKVFKYIGKKAGQTLRKGRWFYKSVAGTEAEAVEAENVVGKELASKLLQQIQLDSNEDTNLILSEIGKNLVSKLNDELHTFVFKSVVSSDVNAFALPGGYIFTTKSILELCNYDKDEIAFILGHEIAHVVKWHIFNRTLTNSSLNLLSVLTKPTGFSSGVAVRTINNLLQNGYSRTQELEADSFGSLLMYAAGYDPKASISVLHRLAGVSGKNEPVFNYFSSHPLAIERVENIKTSMKKYLT